MGQISWSQGSNVGMHPLFWEGKASRSTDYNRHKIRVGYEATKVTRLEALVNYVRFFILDHWVLVIHHVVLCEPVWISNDKVRVVKLHFTAKIYYHSL